MDVTTIARELVIRMGHSTITMTMRYVHHVEEHHRPIPDDILEAGNAVADPDERVIAMLGARSVIVRRNSVATEPRSLSRTKRIRSLNQ